MRFTRSVRKRQREEKERRNLILLDGVRWTTKYPCLLLLSGLFSLLCRQHYLDSQRFYFHFLVLIGLAPFTRLFRSVRRFYLTAQNVYLSSRLCSSFLPKNVYLGSPKNVCLSLITASRWLPFSNRSFKQLLWTTLRTHYQSQCRLLIWSRAEYRQFLAPPMNNDMYIAWTHHAFV